MASSKSVPTPSPTIEKEVSRVQAAERELERYKKAEMDLVEELEALVGKLEEEEAGVGDRILQAKLDGGDADAISQGNLYLWMKMDSTRRALRSASRARANAEAGILHARADEKREEAAALREEVKTRMEKTNKLLQQLREHEGALYQAPFPVHPSGAGYELNKPSTRSGEILMRAVERETEGKRMDEEAARIRQRAQAEYSRPVGE